MSKAVDELLEWVRALAPTTRELPTHYVSPADLKVGDVVLTDDGPALIEEWRLLTVPQDCHGLDYWVDFADFGQCVMGEGYEKAELVEVVTVRDEKDRG